MANETDKTYFDCSRVENNDFIVKISRELGEISTELNSLRSEIRKGHEKIDAGLADGKEQLTAIWNKIDNQNNKIRTLEDKNLIFETEVKSLSRGTKWIAGSISVIISFLLNYKKLLSVFI